MGIRLKCAQLMHRANRKQGRNQALLDSLRNENACRKRPIWFVSLNPRFGSILHYLIPRRPDRASGSHTAFKHDAYLLSKSSPEFESPSIFSNLSSKRYATYSGVAFSFRIEPRFSTAIAFWLLRHLSTHSGRDFASQILAGLAATDLGKL